MIKKALILPLFLACSSLAFAGGWVDRAAGIAANTYVDFPVRAGNAISVLVSNALSSAEGEPSVRPFTLAMPKDAPAEETTLLGLRRYRGRCALFLAGKPAATFDDDNDGLIHLLVDGDSLPEDKGDAYVQNLAPFSFADAFMVAEGDKTGLQSWEQLAGNWSLHAVTGRTVRAQDKTRLSRYPTQERSPNFYCLNGFGGHAVAVAGESFHSHYAVRAALQQNSGTNGIAFMVSDEGEGFTFTAQQDPETGRLDFILRAGCVAGERAGDFVAGVKTELTPGQWYMLEARLTDDEAICYVDNVAVLRAKLDLPAGGRFGLYCDTLEAHPARFDDVSAETWAGVDFALAQDPPAGGAASFGAADDPPASITMRAAPPVGRALTLRVGEAGAGTAWSLLCEMVEDNGPRYRMTLMSETDGTVTTNDTWLAGEPVANPGAEESARAFTLDATTPGIVAGRIDNVTAVMAHASVPPVGRAGYVTDIVPGKRRGGFLAHPSVTREPSPYTDRFEKNKIFVADPFMRHWASAEGQWLTYTNGTAWYKDDVLNRVSLTLPALHGIDLRLGAPEAPLASNGLPVASGECDIRVLCSSNTLFVFNSAATNASPLFSWDYKPARLEGESGVLTATNTVTLRFDGRRFSFASETGAVFSCEIPYPHTGRRMFFAGIPAEHYPAKVLVHREPVIDCLFGESLHDWTINGGTWEVINRFQCYPDWSHMDGENASSVAALWSKYEIAGDFCAMFVCGMRHGGMWYDRVGDFNLTVFNDRTTPSEGYTLKVTDWDPNHSQRWSRLFRNGELMARTDAKAAPRRREGNVRTGYEPLIAKGRDVHGAWYSIKFRRLGDRLEALFDNLPLFSVTDPEPLGSGGFGIWTYRSSMVVARVRVTAERIAPRKFPFKPMEKEPPATAAATSSLAGLPNISFNGMPADLLRPELWHADDEVCCPEITFAEEGDETVMTVTALHGSGSFLASPVLPETTADAVAGWTFEVAHSPDAQFNFAFSLAGKGYTNGYSHVICGTDETRGPRAIVGHSPFPKPTEPDARKKVWTPVTVWIPATGRDPRDETVLLEGFGNLQPSDIQQGLHGNGPGAWFAVRRFYPIYRDTPSPDNASENAPAFAAEVTRALDKGKAGRLNSFKVGHSVCPTRPTLFWTLPPADNQGLMATVLGDPTNAVRIASTLDWPNPLICVSNITVGGVGVPHAYIEDNALYIPFQRPFTLAKTPIVKVSFDTTGGRPFMQMIPAAAFARPRGAPERAPSVTALVFPPSFGASYENFESRATNLGPYLHDGTRRDLRHGDARQSTYLHFHNAGTPSRLSGCLAPVFDIARTPLLQFRYRGDEMALVNISPRMRSFFHFSDNYGGQKRPAQLDDEWHTALCRLTATDFETHTGALFGRAQQKLIFASNHISVPGIPAYHINQTGLFSYLDVDDVAIGPALGPANVSNFMFHATFDAPDGLASAEYAVLPGAEPFDARPDEVRAAISWTAFDPAATNGVAPLPKDLAEGTYHLLVRATSPGGSVSHVADVPFLYDATPPELSMTLSTGAPAGNKEGVAPVGPNEALLTTTVRCGPEGAAPMLTNAVFTVNGTRFAPAIGNVGGLKGDARNTITCAWKWPLVARTAIQASTNGAPIVLRLENVADGAGNVAPAAEALYRIDYAADHIPPSYSLSPHQMLLLAGVGRMSSRESFFTTYGGNLQATHAVTNEEGTARAILSLKITGDPPPKDSAPRTAMLVVNNNNGWLVPTNRWLMLRARVPHGAAAPTGMVFRLAFTAQTTPKDAKTPSKNNIYTLPINAARSADGNLPPGLRQSADFAPGKWVEIVLDVNAYLRATAGTGGDFRLSRLSLILPPVKDAALQLDAAAIMKDIPNLKRAIDFGAVDVSGVDGLYKGDEKIADGWRVTYERLYEVRGDSAFVSLHIRDRAGNKTDTPVIVPLPPRE